MAEPTPQTPREIRARVADLTAQAEAAVAAGDGHRADAFVDQGNALIDQHLEMTGVPIDMHGQLTDLKFQGNFELNPAETLIASGMDLAAVADLPAESQAALVAELAAAAAAAQPAANEAAVRDWVGQALGVDTSSLTSAELRELMAANETKLDQATFQDVGLPPPEVIVAVPDDVIGDPGGSIAWDPAKEMRDFLATDIPVVIPDALAGKVVPVAPVGGSDASSSGRVPGAPGGTSGSGGAGSGGGGSSRGGGTPAPGDAPETGVPGSPGGAGGPGDAEPGGGGAAPPPEAAPDTGAGPPPGSQAFVQQVIVVEGGESGGLGTATVYRSPDGQWYDAAGNPLDSAEYEELYQQQQAGTLHWADRDPSQDVPPGGSGGSAGSGSGTEGGGEPAAGSEGSGAADTKDKGTTDTEDSGSTDTEDKGSEGTGTEGSGSEGTGTEGSGSEGSGSSGGEAEEEAPATEGDTSGGDPDEAESAERPGPDSVTPLSGSAQAHADWVLGDTGDLLFGVKAGARAGADVDPTPETGGELFGSGAARIEDGDEVDGFDPIVDPGDERLAFGTGAVPEITPYDTGDIDPADQPGETGGGPHPFTPSTADAFAADLSATSTFSSAADDPYTDSLGLADLTSGFDPADENDDLEVD